MNNAIEYSSFIKNELTANPNLLEDLSKFDFFDSAKILLNQIRENNCEYDLESFKTLLRNLRRKIFIYIALRDLNGDKDLFWVMQTISDFADFCINLAYHFAYKELTANHGKPLSDGENPQVQPLIIIGMGKLGGKELNVSSDIDLIFVYPENGETNGNSKGKRQIENQEFFSRLSKKIINILGEITGDGFVFRVDMRLRPNGDAGAICCNFATLENYFYSQGREWERYAWIKSRIINFDFATEFPQYLADFHDIVNPFVFRKYLDFGAINAMRDLHSQIRQEVIKKEMQNNIKLGVGGIREIEFIAQVFQLIRGGRYVDLQICPTLQVLEKLQEHQFLPKNVVADLRSAYIFLRNVEHRLQYKNDQQTHSLPENPDDLAALSKTMNFDSVENFLQQIEQIRQNVNEHFNTIFAEPELAESKKNNENIVENFAYFSENPQIKNALNSEKFQRLPESNQQRFCKIIHNFLQNQNQTQNQNSENFDLTLQRLIDFLENIAKKGAYLALLQQYPLALQRLTKLLSVSKWAADYLNKYPLLLDELLDSRLYEENWKYFWQEFRQNLQQGLASANGDQEREMDILREIHHAQAFRLLAQDLAKMHSVERISDYLSELADEILQQTLKLVATKLLQKHVKNFHEKSKNFFENLVEHLNFAIISYGKLGGKELGYASDLDLVYIFDNDENLQNVLNVDLDVFYTRLALRLNSWLSMQTGAGKVFEIDLRLRPNGDAGLLAVSFAGFEEYQKNHAWIWEHQALTRARFSAGNKNLGEKFETLRHQILTLPRDKNHLKSEILKMRDKMYATQNISSKTNTNENLFNLKHSRGGLIDVEFIVQFLVLCYAKQFPELTQNLGNIALLKMSAKLNLIDPDLAEQSAIAYREFRRIQHLIRLNDYQLPLEINLQNNVNNLNFDTQKIQENIKAVKQLWQKVFGN